MNELIQEFLKRLIELDAYYETKRAPDGRRTGPLVGYAGQYIVGSASVHEKPEKKHYVGEVYYNIAAVEHWPDKLRNFTNFLAELLHTHASTGMLRHLVWSDLVVMAAPMGGLSVGVQLAEKLNLPYVFAEKQVTKAAVDGQREESKLVLGRHELRAGQNVLLVEDVCNNFTTTSAICDLVEGSAAKLVAITCLVNRSPDAAWEGRPVISIGHLPTAQYRQDDPFVLDDIAAGNVVWKPKADWPHLMKIMRRE